MNKTVQKIPFLRISFALALGIGLYPFLKPGLTGLFLSSFILLAGIIWIHFHFSYRLVPLWGLIVHLFFLILGLLISGIHNRKPDFFGDGKFYATLSEIPQEKGNSCQALIRIESVCKNDTFYTTGEQVMVWFSKNEAVSRLEPGDQIVFDAQPQRIRNRDNPFEFDYQAYMNRKGIYRQVYLSTDNWKPAGHRSVCSVRIFAERLRMHMIRIYQHHLSGPRERHILEALTLGYKRGLSRETKRIFASAGAMHVLAVSGLHVGILFFVFNFILGFLRKGKRGRIIFIPILITILWLYAVITGLSPSVTRAATMFSFFIVGTNIRRQINIYNSLAASAFFILLIDPGNLFDAGFQLSYVAVFGIVFLQPRLEKLITFKNGVGRFFWSLFTVSLAAQIATFPVSVYYFNQFPVYFWISNIYIIPAVTLLIPMGLALLASHGLPFIPEVLSWLIDFFLGCLFSLLQFVERLPHSVLVFSLTPVELFFLAGFIILLFVFLEYPKPGYFKWALVFLLFVFLSATVKKSFSLFRNEIIVYNQSDNLIVHLISGHANYIVSEKPLSPEGFSYRMVQNTVCRYRLEDPLFFTREDTAENRDLFLRNGVIHFKGRVFYMGRCADVPGGGVSPEIIIGHIDPDQLFLRESDFPLVVTGKYFQEEETTGGINFYCLGKRGAFREQWRLSSVFNIK